MGGNEHTDDGHLAWSCGIFVARSGHKTKDKTKEKEQCVEETKFDELHDGVAMKSTAALVSSRLVSSVAGNGDRLSSQRNRMDLQRVKQGSTLSIAKQWPTSPAGKQAEGCVLE